MVEGDDIEIVEVVRWADSTAVFRCLHSANRKEAVIEKVANNQSWFHKFTKPRLLTSGGM